MNSKLERIVPPALIVLIPLLLYWRLVFAGEVLYWGVPLFQFYPWHSLVAEAVRAGHLPLWTDLLGNGVPLLANHQSATFYPFNLIYLVIPVEYAMGYSVVLHLILAHRNDVGIVRQDVGCHEHRIGDVLGEVGDGLHHAVHVVENDESLHAAPLRDQHGETPRPRARARVVVLRNGPAQHDAPVFVQIHDGDIENVPADVVEVHVDPLGAKLLELLDIVLRGLVVERTVEAEFVDSMTGERLAALREWKRRGEDPTKWEEIMELIRDGERSTWPKV